MDIQSLLSPNSGGTGSSSAAEQSANFQAPPPSPRRHARPSQQQQQQQQHQPQQPQQQHAQQQMSSPLVNVTTPGEQQQYQQQQQPAWRTSRANTSSVEPSPAPVEAAAAPAAAIITTTTADGGGTAGVEAAPTTTTTTTTTTTAARPASGNPLDNLADLASIQQPQQAQAQQQHRPSIGAGAGAPAATATGGAHNPPPSRHRMPPQQQQNEPQAQTQAQGRTPSTMNPNVELVRRSTPRPGVTVPDPPRDTVRTDYTGTCLAPDVQQRATRLATEIMWNRHAYDARVQFIRLLHQGLVDHIYPPSSPESRGDPHQYDVMKDLRAAREELDSLFAIGEDLWAEWIQDESLLARSIDERIAVIELCQRSVEEEYGSTKLWIIYGDWMLHLYNAVQTQTTATATGEHTDADGGVQWSEEDRLIGREAFKWDSVMEVWTKAADTTRWHLNDSHLVWNRYLELALQEVARSPSADNVSHLRGVFDSRLRTPHLAWDETFQLFSSFVSTYYNASYEDIMVDTTTKAAEAKEACNQRDAREMALQRAAEAGDSTAEYTAFAEYLDWETTSGRKERRSSAFSYDLAIALYQRAVLRFPTDASLWEDYMMLAINQSILQDSGGTSGSSSQRTPSCVMPAVARATRHCPWSGSLWSHHLLTAERAGHTLDDISDIKHKATRTGLLDAAGIDQVLKFHTTWCSYLRRNAFHPDATDEDVDIAEVGIRSAIEDVQELGGEQNKTNNAPAPVDPAFRLERIYIQYLSESGSWDSARETFKGLIRRHGHSYEFWLTYYSWEMICWAKFTQSDGSAGASRRSPCPSYATAVLRQALHRHDHLDWPEKIMDTYATHCEHYEDAEELQMAVLDIRKAAKAVAKRREAEAQEQQQEQQQTTTSAAAVSQAYPAPAPSVEQQQQQQRSTQVTDVDGDSHVGKRKREEDELEEPGSNKKPRPEASTGSEDAQAPLKRDREHGTVLVKNLPRDTPALKVRQFFRDCGTVNTLKLLPGEASSDASALIEFESKDDADAALTRDQKTLEGSTIRVQRGNETTVFVTNFPPTGDEAYIRDLFSSYGEIVEVRFPSLKFNTHRRFCYVQFQTSASAYTATELDKKVIGDNLQLVVKISDPSRRDDRSGAVEEGREIHISNLDWKATEDDLAELFTAYGRVEASRIPKKANGRSKGFAFVVFATKDAANAALAMDDQDFRNRPLRVRLSSRTGPKRLATTVVSRVSRSRSPSVSQIAKPNGTEKSPTPMSTDQAPDDDHGAETAHLATGDRRQRTLGLMYVPDTVNDARIRSLVEPFGPLVKIVLRPDHQGAIVEFRDVNDAGSAAMALEGKEIAPGRAIGVGSVEDMLKCGAEKKDDKIRVGKQQQKEQKSATAPSSSLMMRPPIRRPTQPGPSSSRGGRRGGLGVKRGATSSNAAETSAAGAESADSTTTTTTTADAGGRSNSDFRAMLEGSRPKPEAKAEDVDVDVAVEETQA